MAAPCSEASPRSRILPCIAPPPGPLGRARRPRSRASNKAENCRRSVFAVLSSEGGFSHCLHGGAKAREKFEVKDDRVAVAALRRRFATLSSNFSRAKY